MNRELHMSEDPQLRRACIRRGSVEILLVLLAAAVGIGASLWRMQSRKGLRVDPPRYETTVRDTMADVARLAGLDWIHENFSVRVRPGERQNKHGWWERYVADPAGPGWYVAFRESGGNLVIYVSPHTMRLPGGPRSPLAHELAHELYNQHGIPFHEHHARMARDGILPHQ